MPLDRVRTLTAAELGAVVSSATTAPPPTTATSDAGTLPEDDAVLAKVRDAMNDGYAGVILTGVPGSGKSRHALLIARMLTGNEEKRLDVVQFHPSYQYEDFIEGYVVKGQGLSRQTKSFAKLCLAASGEPQEQYIFVIDELSRADVVRVFGEALTYIERSKRNLEFTLASGSTMVVPDNLFLIATMNPWDRGADELDMALERRFAFVEMPPSVEQLRSLLALNGLKNLLIDAAAAFFEFLQQHPNPHCRLGHGYFVHARDRESLLRLWSFQLAHVLERACRNDRAAFDLIEQQWNDLVVTATGTPSSSSA